MKRQASATGPQATLDLKSLMPCRDTSASPLDDLAVRVQYYSIRVRFWPEEAIAVVEVVGECLRDLVRVGGVVSLLSFWHAFSLSPYVFFCPRFFCSPRANGQRWWALVSRKIRILNERKRKIRLLLHSPKQLVFDIYKASLALVVNSLLTTEGTHFLFAQLLLPKCKTAHLYS